MTLIKQHGVSLVEALVALAITMLAIVGLVDAQLGLRQHADLVRQRAEAVQLAQAEIEKLRAFPSQSAYAALPALPAQETATLRSNTRFEIERQLATDASPQVLDARVTVHWADRSGAPAAVTLSSLVAGIDPSLSGRLAQSPADGSVTGPGGRAWIIPATATDLGDGNSALRPPGQQGVAWVFDNASGHVAAVCTVPDDGALTADNLTQCLAIDATVVSGWVRFSTGPAADPRHPGSTALDLDMQLALQQGELGPGGCVDDAHTRPGQAQVTYLCLVVADSHSHRWSGRLDVQPLGWTASHRADGFRVCRYSADQDGRNGITNDEHPLDYRDVAGALANQNFLVVRGDVDCPADAPQAQESNASTVEQAPDPAATPTR